MWSFPRGPKALPALLAGAVTLATAPAAAAQGGCICCQPRGDTVPSSAPNTHGLPPSSEGRPKPPSDGGVGTGAIGGGPRPAGTAPSAPGHRPGTGSSGFPALPAPVQLPFPGALGAAPDPSRWELWWSFRAPEFVSVRETAAERRVRSRPSVWLGVDAAALEEQVPARPTPSQVDAEVIPALLHVLETESNPTVLAGAAMALAKVGDPAGRHGSARALRALLTDVRHEVQGAAVLGLGLLGDEGQIELLTELMGDTRSARATVRRAIPVRTRAFAAYGLGLLAERAPDEEARREIATALLAELRGAREARPDVKVAALLALGLTDLDWYGGEELDRRDLLAELTGALEARPGSAQAVFADDLVRAQLPLAAARLAVDARAFTGGEASAARSRLISALLGAVEPGSVEALAVRRSAIMALGRLGDAGGSVQSRAIVQGLSAIVRRGPDPVGRAWALTSLGEVGGRMGPGDGPWVLAGPVRDVLLGELSGKRGGRAPWAALGLGIQVRGEVRAGQMIDAGAARAVGAAFAASGNAEDMGAYALALGLMGDAGAELVLMERLDALGSGADLARGSICLALGMIGGPKAREVLVRAVKAAATRPRVLRDAAMGLGLLGGSDASGVLAAMSTRARTLSTRAAIAGALGAVADAGAVDQLVLEIRREAEATGSDLAIAYACGALGVACDKDLRTWRASLLACVNHGMPVETLSAPGSGVLDLL